MARVQFIRDFDWKPTPQTTIAYKAGGEHTVRRECADAAVKAGAATEGDDQRKPADGTAE
jgi:hypothetical protein